MSQVLDILNVSGSKVGDLEINEGWLEREKGAQAIHEVVVAILANRRAGTACTKTRSEVRGGGAKPWRQKGTGRARAGSSRSPVWVGGGVIFGPRPRKYTKKVNKKVKRLALRRAFTEALDAGKVILVDNLSLADAKSKTLSSVLQAVGGGRKTLVVVAKDYDATVVQAGRNLANATVTSAKLMNVYELLRHDKVLITQEALDILGGRLA